MKFDLSRCIGRLDVSDVFLMEPRVCAACEASEGLAEAIRQRIRLDRCRAMDLFRRMDIGRHGKLLLEEFHDGLLTIGIETSKYLRDRCFQSESQIEIL